MKYLIIFIIFFLNSFNIQAQSSKKRDWNLKLLPQHLLPNVYSFSGEYFLKNKPQYSFSLGLSFSPKRNRVVNNNRIFVDRQVEYGFGMDCQMRHYFKPLQTPQSGFYYSPIFRFEYFSSDYAFLGINPDSIRSNPIPFVIENTQAIVSNQLGLHIGFQYVFFKHLLVDLYAGVAYRYSFSVFRDGKEAGAYYPVYSVDWFEHSFDRAYTGILPKLGFQIGFAF